MYVLVCNILIKGQNEFDVSFLSFQSSSNIKKGIQRRRQRFRTEDRETARPPKNHPILGTLSFRSPVLSRKEGDLDKTTLHVRICLLFTFSQSEVHLSLHMRVDSLEEEYQYKSAISNLFQ
jgi:hypothetical protein